MVKLPTTPPPPGYILGDWDLRLQRVEICINCEHHFLDDSEDDPNERVFYRTHCAECACSSYMMSGDVYRQRCPLNKWPVLQKENDENIQHPTES